MILVQWSCKVSMEKRKQFINFAEEKLKPFYESYGCLRYELFFPLIAEKNYFSYQIKEKENRYFERLLFKNLKDFEKFYNHIDKDKFAQEIVRSYVKEYGISKCNFSLLELY